ncbi:MAG: FtsX-like permease family protein [Chlorobium sp.]|jgi:lipoprotein-releasing system permease protein|uniref:FtsX-like permease family protein n=1 Tax=Chlorobium sp. TaxID=1095 RepID=UPI0025C080A4|nr:FtsX-like permease family protein [Chlorobium sp.]MCF8216800.1 FtsX-like permease family protein [Chlorobium sp.]MCF8271551.1 FtsX-like permease family protein [Chlorobium sp.]MCF8287923.1 FtsX-like permease family protein [Chlorobium sp.]MCF8291601.1 FtsX-like permease family protein [Chlorobium sp.]MCF8385592.1 FtsX-like permease family protein [Chlorobium sp.]
MNPMLYIAKRFAFRERNGSKPAFIVLASVTGIAVGTAALILTLSIVKGFATSVENKLISFTSHIQVRQTDKQYFTGSRYDQRLLADTPGVVSASPFLEKNFMLQGRKRTPEEGLAVRPAVIKGVTENEKMLFLERYGIRETQIARNIENKDMLSLYLGKSMAEKLGVKPGDKVLLAGLDKTGTMEIGGKNQDIVGLLSSLDLETGLVSGIYESGLQDGFDDTVVLGSIEALQRRFNPGMISGYDIEVQDARIIGSIAQELSEKLEFPFYTYTVFERYANLFEWLKLQKNITPLLIITITIVAVFNIISTLLVLVIEKTREIGMLAALGLEPRQISRIFLSQSLLIALAGISSGAVFALLLTLFEQRFHLIRLPEKSYFISYVPLMIDPFDYLMVGLAVLVLTMLFAFIPARIASSLKPGTALTT